MINLFYGLDGYSRRKKISALIEAILKKHPQTTVRNFYLDEEGEIESLYEFLSSGTLFEKAKRVACVKNSNGAEDSMVFNRTISFMTGDKESVLIFDEDWEEKEIPKNLSAPIKNQQIKTFYFPKLDLEESVQLIFKESKRMGANIEIPAVRYLIQIFSGDISACINEITRISFLEKPISVKFIESLGEYRMIQGIYDFSRAALNGGISDKLRLWEIMLNQKTDPYIIFNYLAKSAATAGQIKKIADADVGVKSGLLEPQQALLAFLLS